MLPRPKRFTTKIKKWLTESPLKHSIKLEMANNLALLNDWRKRYTPVPYFPHRDELYDYISAEVVGEKPITYLEFGVFQGESIRYWTKLNSQPGSEFIGFDTFEGLPEKWHRYVRDMDRGHFDSQGQPPRIDDKRVRFLKGLFQDSLPGFLKTFETSKQLVINNDSDLYSSTLFTLCSLHPFLTAGTVIIFDEFSCVLDEFKALEDYRRAFLRKYKVVGASGQYYDRVAIRFTE